MSDSIEIISWNVNGIRTVGNKDALKWVDERQTDILCLQEIKALEEQIPDNLFEKKYTDVIVNSATKKGYSGTMTSSEHCVSLKSTVIFFIDFVRTLYYSYT